MRTILLFAIGAIASAQALVIHGFQASSSVNSCTMNAAGHRCFVSFITPRPMLVSGAMVRIGSVTAGDTIRVSIQTVSGNFPSGTVLASGDVSVGTGNANSFVTATFPAAVQLARAERYAVVLEFPSYTSGNLVSGISAYTQGYIGLSDIMTGVLMGGRYDGSVWSLYSTTTALGVILLDESGSPHQMYWTAWNTKGYGVYFYNTQLGSLCTAQQPMRIDGLMISRATGNYSNYVALSIIRNGVPVWSQQWSLLRIANAAYVVVPVQPSVVVGAGETVAFRIQGSGYLMPFAIDNVQIGAIALRQVASSGMACRPESGTVLPAIWPVVKPLSAMEEQAWEW